MRTGRTPLVFFEIIGRTTIKFLVFLIKIVYLILLSLGNLTLKIGHLTYKALLSLVKIKSPLVQLIKVLLSTFLYPIKFFSGVLRNFFLFLGKLRLPSIKIKVKIKIKKATFFKITLLFFFFLSFFLFYSSILKDLPRPHKLLTREPAISTKIYDRNGKLLYKIYRNQNRTLVKIDELPPYLVQATVAIEDKDFYQHQGFSLRGIFRALKQSLFERQLQGGSTITQQLVKNTLLSPEKTLKRKIKEVILAIQVETYFSKKEILQMYLNEVPYGGTAYGIEEASQTYFGKSAKELNLAQAALLAGLPAAPTRFSPLGAHPHLAVLRQHEVLQQMVKEGYLNPESAEKAKTEKMTFIMPHDHLEAPHFVMFVKDLLVEKYGLRMVEEGGLEVTTSLDLEVQKMAQNVVKNEINKIQNLQVTNGAVLITKPATGEILAMVGSRDYFDKEIDGNVNVTISPRQPGSAIKVVNYAYALQHGYSAATIIQDTPITYKIPGSPPYSPVNYDSRFHGPVTLRTALASSYNVPAVKVLSSYGVDKMLTMGKELGITTWEDRSRFGLSLTLGGGEVKMIEMAVVYGTLSNLGKRVDLNPILEVKDYQGKALEDLEIINQRVLPAGVAYILTDILKDNPARTPAFGPNSDLLIPEHEVAVKTGTTNDKRDNWTIGYTSDFLVTVWVGNNDSSPMGRVVSGVTGASPIWHQITTHLLEGKETHHFTKPGSLLKVQICSTNGLLPCEGCPTKEEYFLPGTSPTRHCQTEKPEELKEKEKESKDKILEGVSTERKKPRGKPAN